MPSRAPGVSIGTPSSEATLALAAPKAKQVFRLYNGLCPHPPLSAREPLQGQHRRPALGTMNELFGMSEEHPFQRGEESRQAVHWARYYTIEGTHGRVQWPNEAMVPVA